MLISRREVNGSSTEPRERTESENAKARVRDRWRCKLPWKRFDRFLTWKIIEDARFACDDAKT